MRASSARRLRAGSASQFADLNWSLHQIAVQRRAAAALQAELTAMQEARREAAAKAKQAGIGFVHSAPDPHDAKPVRKLCGLCVSA